MTSTRTGHGSGGGQARLHGIIGRLLAAQRGERNRLLFWASLRIGELVAEVDLDAAAAWEALAGAAAQVGLAGEDGQRAAAATIRSGFQRMGVAYEPRGLTTPPRSSPRSASAAYPARITTQRQTGMARPATTRRTWRNGR